MHLAFSSTPTPACGCLFSAVLLAALPVYRVQHQAVRSIDSVQTQVVALVLSRLDYGNASHPPCLVNHLQSVLNATAQSIASLRLSDRIADTFRFSLAMSSGVASMEQMEQLLPPGRPGPLT